MTSSSHSLDPCICLIRNNLLGVSKDDFLIAIDANDYNKVHDAKSKARCGLDNSNSNTLKPMQWSSPLMGLGKYLHTQLVKHTVFVILTLSAILQFGMSHL